MRHADAATSVRLAAPHCWSAGRSALAPRRGRALGWKQSPVRASAARQSPVGRRTDDLVRARRAHLVAALAGLAFIVLVLGSFFTPDTASADASAEETVAALVADRSGHQTPLLLRFLGDTTFFVFLAGVRSRQRRWEAWSE